MPAPTLRAPRPREAPAAFLRHVASCGLRRRPAWVGCAGPCIVADPGPPGASPVRRCPPRRRPRRAPPATRPAADSGSTWVDGDLAPPGWMSTTSTTPRPAWWPACSGAAIDLTVLAVPAPASRRPDRSRCRRWLAIGTDLVVCASGANDVAQPAERSATTPAARRDPRAATDPTVVRRCSTWRCRTGWPSRCGSSPGCGAGGSSWPEPSSPFDHATCRSTSPAASSRSPAGPVGDAVRRQVPPGPEAYRIWAERIADACHRLLTASLAAPGARPPSVTARPVLFGQARVRRFTPLWCRGPPAARCPRPRQRRGPWLRPHRGDPGARGAGDRITGVAGSSMGCAGRRAHAAGRLDEYTEWSSASPRRTSSACSTCRSRRRGRSAGRDLRPGQDLLGDALIEDLPIPFTAVATDLLAARRCGSSGPVDGRHPGLDRHPERDHARGAERPAPGRRRSDEPGADRADHVDRRRPHPGHHPQR